MNNKLVLLGGGGHCTSVLDSVLSMHIYSEVIILDPNIPVNTEIMGCRVWGDDSLLEELRKKGFDNAFISLGSIRSSNARRNIYNNVKQFGYNFPNIIDSTAVISKFAKLGQGVYVGKNVIINSMAHIGDMAIINNGSIIEHGCDVGDFTHVAVGAVICGSSRIGADCFIGANATVIQEISINHNSFVQAGAVVLSDI